MKEPKFKVGDKVRVLDGSKIPGYTGGWVNDTMAQEVGKTHIITGTGYCCFKTGYRLDFRDTKYGTAFVWDERGLELVDSKPKTEPFKIPFVWDERGLELVDGKKEPKFKIGDKVRVCTDEFFSGSRYGKTFTIVRKRLCGDNIWYKVEEDGGWWKENMLEFVTKFPKIIITTDGKTTLARMYDGKKVIKSAEAHCSPEDEFDFNIGAKIAFERLIGDTTKIKISAEIPKEIADKLETIKATGKAFLTALEDFK